VAHKERVAHDDFNVDTSTPIHATVFLAGLSADDLDYFEVYVESRRRTGASAGGPRRTMNSIRATWLVLRPRFAPAAPHERSPAIEYGEALVHEADTVLIGCVTCPRSGTRL
jgi:hypothetical protein